MCTNLNLNVWDKGADFDLWVSVGVLVSFSQWVVLHFWPNCLKITNKWAQKILVKCETDKSRSNNQLGTFLKKVWTSEKNLDKSSTKSSTQCRLEEHLSIELILLPKGRWKRNREKAKALRDIGQEGMWNSLLCHC